MFDVTLEGIPELEAAWRKARRALAHGCYLAVRQGCKEGADFARANHRYQDHTRTLTNSIEGYVTQRSEGAGGCEGILEARAPYAGFVEHGTRPHIIEVRANKRSGRGGTDMGMDSAQSLHWTDKAGGEHFAQRVRHPGTPSMPFMGPAFQQCERSMERELRSAMVKAEEIMER